MVLWKFFFSSEGRMTRAQYWLDVQLPLITTGVFIGRLVERSPDGTVESIPGWVISFFFIFGLAPSVRRWHDREKSGWWTLVGLIPLLGPAWVFVELNCLPGTRGWNRFGAEPLAVVGERGPWTSAKRHLIAWRSGLAVLLLVGVVTTPDVGMRAPCFQDLGRAGSVPVTREGAWDGTCRAAAFHTRKYARYYSFTLAGPGRVTIDLASPTADTRLALREGTGSVAGRLLANDDDGGGGLDARIERDLEPGEYTIEATTYIDGVTGRYTLTVGVGDANERRN